MNPHPHRCITVIIDADSNKYTKYTLYSYLNTSIKELTENTEQDTLWLSGVFVNTSALTQTYCIPLHFLDLRERLF